MTAEEIMQRARSSTQYKEKHSAQSKSAEEIMNSARQEKFQRDVSKVDKDYLDLFTKTANDFFSSAQEDYSTIGWDNAGSVYKKNQSTLADLDYRRSVISSWLASNKDSLEADSYKSLSDAMELFSSDSSKVMAALTEAKDYYDKVKNQDAYLAYVDHQNKMNYDLSAGQKKIDDLNRAISLGKDIQAIGHDVPGDITYEYDKILRAYGLTGNEDLKELLTSEEVMFNQSKWAQKEVELSSAVDNPDFAKYSQMGAEMQNPSYSDANGHGYIFGWRPGADPVQNKVTFARDNAEALLEERTKGNGNVSTPTVVDPIYRHMTDDEVSIYNYYLAKEGDAKADEYLESLQDKLNQREAAEEYARIQGRTAQEILYGVTVGVDQFRSGMGSLFDDSDYIAPSAIQYAGQAARQDLEDNGPKIFGSSLGQIGYDALSTTANMAPSILASMAVGMVSKTGGAVVGNALLGASAAGNAYAEKLNAGYSKEQARTYGVMVGASEIAMEKLLGGISALGGGNLSKMALSNLDKVDNILARVAKSTGGKILMNAGSEALEEGLQSILEPYLWQAVSGEDASVDWQEALYSSLLGFVTGGVFEGANASFETVALNNETKQKYGPVQGEIVTEALEIDPDSNFAQRMQSKLDNGKDLSGGQINKLLKNNEAGLVKNDIASIQKAAETALTNYGETGDVKIISEALAKQAAGKKLSKAERTVISESKYGQRVANELNPENIQSGDFNTAWAESINTDRINAEEYGRLVADAEASPASAESITDAPEGSATANLTGADSTISEEVSDSTVEADASVSLEEASRKYGAQAKAMVATFNPGQDVASFDRAYSVAYEMGKSGVSMDYAVNSRATSYLTQAQRELAYRQGTFATTNKAKSVDAMFKGKGSTEGGRRRGAVKLEGIKASEFRKMLKDSNDPRGKAAKALMTIAEVTGIDIVLFKSQVDASGKYVGEQGRFEWKNDTIYIDVNAGLSYGSDAGELTKYAMLRTFGHEFTHFLEKNAATQYTEFRKLVFAEMTKAGKNVDYLIQRKQAQYKDQGLSYEAASREVVAESMGDILRDSNFIETLAQKHNSLFKTLLDQFKRFIRNIRSYFNSIAKNSSPEAEALKEEINGTLKYMDSIVEAFDKIAVEAVENYQARMAESDGIVAELTPGQEGVVVDKDGEPVAYSTEDGTVMLSIRTYEEEGRSAFRTYLEKCVKNKSLTETEMTEMLDGIEDVYNICKKFKDKYAPFSAWSDAEVIRDTKGKPVFSVVTPNGEYKMNLDFSLVCKKRRALDAVFNEMSKRGIIDDFELGKKTVVKINELIRKYKFETACSLCFVDAKRYRQADVADSVVRLYNELVQSLVPEEHIGSIERFNFAGYATIKPVADGIHTWPNSKLDFSHINEVLKQYEKDTVEAKAARYIKNNPDARKLLLRGDFMSSGGFDAVKSQNQNIMSLYNSKKGTGGPKAAFGDVQYLNEVISKARWWTPKKAYEVGGVRVQSFSDYVPRMVFDYVQMIYDLAATKLPAHAYTKEVLFVMQFGKTGIKINMSLIPAVVEDGIAPGLDANGDYVWAGESFDYNTAVEIQSKPGYTENCGTICVGVSYEHILKLLRDPNIRMVIPYHKSGLNPIVAHMNKVDKFVDYTSLKSNPGGCQNTMDAEGKKVEKDFNFNEALRKSDDPRAAADAYLKWCNDHGYTPKFAEFRKEKNYYKLLVDFTVYDESGTYVPQREVRAVFPKEGDAFGSMKDLIKEGLEEDAVVQGKRDASIPEIVDEIERTIPRTEAEISDDEQVEQADHDLEADLLNEDHDASYDSYVVQKQVRNYATVEEMDADYMTAVESGNAKAQQRMVAEAAKLSMADSVVVDEKGKLLAMYHGTANGGAFTVFEGDKLSNDSRTSQIGQGFYFTNVKKEAEAYTKNVDIYGRVNKGSAPHLHKVYLNITNPFDVRKDSLDLDKAKAVYMDGGYDYFYNSWIPFYLDKKSVNGKVYAKTELTAMTKEQKVSLYVDYLSQLGVKEVLSNMVRAFSFKSQGALLESMKVRLGYDGIVEEYRPGAFQYVAFSSEQIKSADPVTYDDNGNVIPLSERFNEENPDIRYSLRTYDDDYAPTFYSQMEKVVSGMKQDKFGASSVVDMLRGRGVKAEEIKWSGIETWLEGKKSVTKAELQEFIAGSMLQIEEEQSDPDSLALRYIGNNTYKLYGADGNVLDTFVFNKFMGGYISEKTEEIYSTTYEIEDAVREEYGSQSLPRWSDYKLMGGTNYREIVFRLPNNSYSNRAMRVHWGDDAEGVLAHARIQDFTVNGKKTLFVEELQSDYHNEGHGSGYSDSKTEDRLEALKAVADEKFFALEDYSTEMTGVAGEWETVEKTVKGARLLLEHREAQTAYDKAMDEFMKQVPDAPFKDTYHEYVMKRLLRMAAEQGYDSIGWTTSETQIERWTDEFAKGFRIEYDQDIPKFLAKYGKKWGATVSKTQNSPNGITIWQMDIPEVMQDSVLYEGQAQYQKRTNTLTDHEILDMAAKELDTSKLTDAEKSALDIFRKRVEKLKALKEERQKQGSIFYEHQFGANKDTAKATAARNRMTVLDNQITKASAEVLGLEDKKVLKDVLQKSRKVIEQKERKESLERIRVAREETRAKERKIANEKLEALRLKKNAQIAEVRAEEREKATDRVKTVRESYQSSRLREKIKAFKAKLEKNLLNPTERQYVPAGLTQAMIDVVNLIDIDTDLVNPDGTVNKAQERRNETKMKLSDLAAEYEKLKASDPVYAGEFDEAVYNYLTELRDNFAGRHLREMTLGELTEMYEILRSIEETLQDARKLIGWGDAETVYEAGDAIIAEQNAITAKRKDGKRTWQQEKRDNSLALTLSPVRYVERMSAYHQNSYLLRMFKAFEKGERKKNFFKMQAYKSFEALTSRQQYEDAIYTPVGSIYTDANGRSFRLSKMQMMQAILSLERELANNMSHIEGSGFSFADLDMLKKGRLKDAISEEHSHRVPNAVDMVGEFINLLKDDKWAQDYMVAARKFFNETAKDAINETSLALKHRIVAKDKSYIPFEVDKNFIVNEISAANDVQQTINSYGMLKDTKKFASNPLIITGLNNILDRHIEQVGNIYGLAIEVRNFNKVWNVRGLDANSGDPTVKATIQRNWGDKGLKLVEQAVQDIQGPRHNSQSDLYKKIKSGYIGATFLLNLSVVSKQIGSLFSATSMLRWRGPVRQIGNLLYTMTHSKKLSAEVDKYTASAWMRRQGLSDAEVYTLMTEGKRTWLGRLANKAPAMVNPTKWITAMDHTVALSLWKYAKEDTAKRTGLKGEALLQATAEFYDELIENTQSMTDVLHRPEIQKRSDVISESFGMFKTDLYQMAGQLLVSGERYHANKTKDNRNALVRTAYAVTMSAVWAQLMTTVFALLRYKVDQYRDDEDKDLTAESWLKRQGVALAGDIAGYIFPLLGSEIVGFVENIFTGESDELVDSLGITAINNAYDTIIKVLSPLADGELPKTSDLRKLTTSTLQMFGVPANNILRTLDAIQLHAKDIANGRFLSFEAGVQRSSTHHANRIMEALEKGNTDLANALFEEAVEEAALKKSEDGSISEEALKDARSSLQTAFGKKYKDGEISAEQAEKILVDLFGKSEDDAYWTIKAWDTGDSSKYSAVFDAALSGTGFNEALKEMTDHGYKKDDVLAKLKTQIKAWYTDEESETRITKQQATDMLKKYVGMSSDEVTSIINEWSCKVVTGIAYDDIKGEFLTGNITASRAIDMRVRYGGKSRADVQKEVEGWNFEKKYGFSYSDRVDAFLNGKISSSAMRTALMEYGGMSGTEADDTIKAYEWMKRNPRYDLSVSDVIGYIKPIEGLGYSLEHAGVSPDTYVQYKDLRSNCKGVDANGDGKTDSGSVKAEVLEAIDSLPISDSQKDALYYLNGWAASKLWEAPWH